jgi:uncharacterized membrane protein YphA (DoxX/SURF4 family)
VGKRLDWLGLAIRVGLGVVFLFASVPKLSDPYSNVQAVKAYELLPAPWFRWVGYGQPMVELLIGLCLLVGLLTRVSGALATLLFAAFIFGIAWAWSHGLEIRCGCFSRGGASPGSPSNYPLEILRDIGLLAMSAYLVWRPRSVLALDNWLFRPVQAADTDDVPAV